MSSEPCRPAYWTPILYDVTRILESDDGPEARIERVLALMRRFVPFDRCALLESSPVLQRSISIAQDVSAEERDALVARVARLLKLVTDDALDEMRTPPPAPGQAHLAVPIIGLGETTGIIFVERAQEPYEDAHLAFLSVIAAQVGAYLAAVRSIRDLRASEAQFRGLYESGMIGIVFMDRGGAISDANRTFTSLTGPPGVTNWYDRTSPEHLDRERAAIRTASESGRCAPYEKEFVLPEGRRVTALAGAARLESKDALVGFVVDISEQKRVEAERAGLLEERESDLELLQLFVGMLSHDLRNPLGAIRMSAEMIRHVDDEDLAKTAARILATTDRMNRMVEQLLDLTRIRLAGGIPVEPRRVDLRDVCVRVIDELKASHPDGSLILDVTGDAMGEWDADRLLQVVSNLVGNAIQHSRGRADVSVHVIGTASDVELSVHNPGAIPADLLPVLFDPFRGAAVRRSGKGLGLGLFIAKHIVDAHCGSIEVDSAEPRGTKFTVRLPRRRR